MNTDLLLTTEFIADLLKDLERMRLMIASAD